MRTYAIPLAVAIVLVSAFSLNAAEKPRPAQGNQNQPKRIWTNDDMDQLRARGLISFVGPGEAAPATQAPAEPAAQVETTFPVYASRLDDPAWYADEAAALQAELEVRQAALRDQLTAITQAVDRITQPGIALDKDSPGVTPEAGVQVLQAKVQEVQNQLDELSDLARQHNIAPGVLRG